MLHYYLRSALVPFVLAMATCVVVDAAQAFRLSYVSLTGNDANACTLAAPCRTLTHAIAATTVGGEVRLLDSAGYGAAITIGKSITISGDGATVFAGPVTINSAAAVVTLRDLVLNGGGAAADATGVTIAAARTVHIERCTIHGFPAVGIEIDSDGVDVFVTDGTVRDNGIHGLVVSAGATARLMVANSHFDANGLIGLSILSGHAVIDRTSASDNGRNGISLSAARATVTSTVAAHNGAGFPSIAVTNGSDLTLESSVMRGNGTGLTASTGGTVRLSNSVVTQNAFGVVNNASTVLTRRNNTVSGNGTNVSGTLTPLGGV